MNKYLLLIFPILIYIVLILQGCVGTFTVGAIGVITKFISDPRTIGEQIDDNTLKIKITNALSENKKLKKNIRIINTVYKGKVLLTGQVFDLNLSRFAKQIVTNIKGTVEVYNEIRQEYPVSIKISMIDFLITVKIILQLLINNNNIINLSNIKIITENSEVFLLGTINHNQEKIITQIINKISGIKCIITIFDYE